LVALLGIFGILGTINTLAAPTTQVPIVRPDAITTPTGTLLIATPTAAEEMDAGYHERSSEQRYYVQPGDTLLTIALETGVDLALLPCAVRPDFQPNQPLVINDELVIPGATLLCYQVAPGETLNTIAANHHTTAARLSAIAWNQLHAVAPDMPLAVGRNIQIPLQPLAKETISNVVGSGEQASFLSWMLDQPVDSSPFLALAVGGPFAAHNALKQAVTARSTDPAPRPGAVPENWPYGSGAFTWPLAGWLTQGYRYDHRALDIAAPFGTTVTAADRGTVIRAGWNDQGYGLFVIIDHNIDYITLYGHLSEVLVEEGDIVGQGEVIGKVGSTGNSTGPHLHFEIRDFGRLTNPLELLVH